jgi:hypothetical protein
MEHLELFFIVSLSVQLAHSVEELTTGFHKKWYLFKMPFWIFLSFELIFSLFWISVVLIETFPFRANFQEFFLVLMFANGIQHIIWSRAKKYVPGLITGCLHILVFLAFIASL